MVPKVVLKIKLHFKLNLSEHVRYMLQLLLAIINQMAIVRQLYVYSCIDVVELDNNDYCRLRRLLPKGTFNFNFS